MNRREANRIAKHLYTGYGEGFLSVDYESFVDHFHMVGETYNERELATIYDYYQRTCKRVADWLGVPW
jgi:hypothetical protein